MNHVAEIEIDSPLSPEEQKDFDTYRTLLDEGFKTMEKMALALRDIQRRRLYRGKFRTFEAYVRTEWDMAISRAYQLCSYGTVIENLRLHNCGEIPRNEAQARELAKLPEDEQPKVWATVIESGEKPTAKTIKRVAVEIVKPKPMRTIHPDVKEPPPVIVEADFAPVETDVLKPSRTLIRVWDELDASNRLAFLVHVFPRPGRLRGLIDAACKRKKKPAAAATPKAGEVNDSEKIISDDAPRSTP